MREDRHAETARRFGVVSDCEKLERELLEIPGVTSVEFDLDGLYDNMDQVIILVGYDIDVTDPNYYGTRSRMCANIIYVCSNNGLHFCGDTIEDYGEHLYLVRQILSGWTKKEEN